MDCAMDFVAFDFETANSRADSACQLAVVSVRGGQIAAERSWFIRPPRLYFSPRHISIHGIRPEQVAQSPTMEQIWPELAEFVDGQVMVAHNAGFDVGVLVASLAAFDVACPHVDFSCTRAIARRTWPGRSGYGLKPLGSWLGIDFRHHDALEDSRCCAQVALAAAATVGAESFSDLEKRLRLSRGRYSLGRVSGPRTIGGRAVGAPRTQQFKVAWPPSAQTNSAQTNSAQTNSAQTNSAQTNFNERTANTAAHGSSLPSSAARTARPPLLRTRMPGRGQIDAVAVIEAAAGSQPLAHKRIVCLGNLRGLSALETKQLIEALGAENQSQIARDTDYVVACGGTLLDEANQMIARTVESPASSEATPPYPRTIRLLSERQFLALLPGGKSAIRW